MLCRAMLESLAWRRLLCHDLAIAIGDLLRQLTHAYFKSYSTTRTMRGISSLLNGSGRKVERVGDLNPLEVGRSNEVAEERVAVGLQWREKWRERRMVLKVACTGTLHVGCMHAVLAATDTPIADNRVLVRFQISLIMRFVLDYNTDLDAQKSSLIPNREKGF